MAIAYARVMRSIWGDDDFRDLPMPSQWLYFHLLTSPALNHAGVTDWRPARMTNLTRGLTTDAVEAASVDLEGNAYILVDRDTEEVLIRTFIRHDGLMAQPNMAAAMVKAHAGTSSNILRGVIVHELKRLRKDEPNLKGWGHPGVSAVLRKDPIAPSDALEHLPRYGFSPSVSPSVKGVEKGAPRGSHFDPEGVRLALRPRGASLLLLLLLPLLLPIMGHQSRHVTSARGPRRQRRPRPSAASRRPRSGDG